MLLGLSSIAAFIHRPWAIPQVGAARQHVLLHVRICLGAVGGAPAVLRWLG